MESLIIAAQDQAINMRYHQKYIMKQPTDRKCKMCCNAEEHIKLTVVGCTKLAPSEYSNKYNKVAGYIHWTICKHTSLLTGAMNIYQKRVVNINHTTIMWDTPVITD
jgi:hypothetical protein